MRILTTSEVARLLGVSEDAVRVWEGKGLLRATRTGTGQRLFRESDVQDLMRKRETRRRGELATKA